MRARPSAGARPTATSGRLAILTGCDSGIGACLRAELTARGFRVLASYLGERPPPAGADELDLRLDLRDGGQVRAFAEAAMAELTAGQRLGLLVLNAGSSAVGAVENLSIEKLREVFEVNFFGHYELVQALLPLVRRDRARICLVSSAAGKIALPYFSAYSCSKFAVEALGDTLRRELGRLGCPVILFEPRAIATPIWERTWAEAEGSSLPGTDAVYRPGLLRGAGTLMAGAKRGMEPEEAAAFIARKALEPRPAPRYVVSRKRLLAWAQLRAPARLADRIVAAIFRA